MQRFQEGQKPETELVGEVTAPGAHITLLSQKEQRALAAEKARLAEEVRIEAALEEFRAVSDSAVRKQMIAVEEAGRKEYVESARGFDAKVSPILAVAGVLIAGILTIAKDWVHFDETPVTMLFLVASTLALFYSVIKSVITVSPRLQVAEPVARVFGFLHLFSPRHIAADSQKENQGQLYFGHVAQRKDTSESIRAAVAYYADEPALFRDTVTQKWANARICAEKCQDIAMAVYGIFVAILLLFAAGFCFVFRW